MKTGKVYLYEGRDDVFLTTYIAEPFEEIPFNAKRKAILIFPGGAYWFISPREGEPIAFSFMAKGFNAFVLNYTVKGKARFPAQLLEASMCMKILHERAEEFHIDTDYIFTAGFSAGGHVCASHGTMWDKDFIFEKINMPKEYNRPRGMILAYPVITSGEFSHEGSIKNLLGGENYAKPAMRDFVSLEKAVTENTVPAFIWHTVTDNVVPIQNSTLFISALANHGVPFEAHLYPTGPHGLSLANKTVGVNEVYPSVPGWADLAATWAQSL